MSPARSRRMWSDPERRVRARNRGLAGTRTGRRRQRNGAQPGRTYRVRREDLDAFVAASSEGRLALNAARWSPRMRSWPSSGAARSSASPDRAIALPHLLGGGRRCSSGHRLGCVARRTRQRTASLKAPTQAEGANNGRCYGLPRRIRKRRSCSASRAVGSSASELDAPAVSSSRRSRVSSASWNATSASSSVAFSGPASFRAAAECSNVASGVVLTEILAAARDAITAIEPCDIAIAKTRLRAILDLMRGLDDAVPRFVLAERPPPSA